jgi:hypothetical protein
MFNASFNIYVCSFQKDKRVGSSCQRIINRSFPHVLGAADGKHIHIVSSPGGGSYYYNYTATHSVVLVAIVKANYEFILADFGVNGCVSDGGV